MTVRLPSTALLGVSLFTAALMGTNPVSAHPDNQVHRQQFMLYFSAQSATLETAAQDTIVAGLRSAPDARVHLVAHTDTRGSAYANLLLSMAMAQSAANEFIRQGIDPGKITIEAMGETKLARQTADDVSEPLNRRVEVTLY